MGDCRRIKELPENAEFICDTCPYQDKCYTFKKMNEKELVNIIEYYDEKGICRKRTANGIDLPADTEPSMAYFTQDIAWVEEKLWMTQEEFKHRFPLL